MWSEHFGEESETSPQDREIMAEWDSVIDNWYDQALANGQGFKSEEEKKAYLDSLGDPRPPYVCHHGRADSPTSIG